MNMTQNDSLIDGKDSFSLETLFNTATKISSMMVHVVDMDTHELLFTNEAGFRLLGKEPMNYHGQKCYKVFFDGKEPCANCKIKDVLDGQTEFYENRSVFHKVFKINSQIFPYNGRRIYVEFSSDVTNQVEEQKRKEEWYQKKLDVILHAYPDALGSFLINITKDYVTNQRRLYSFVQKQEDQSISKYLLKMKENIPSSDFVLYERRMSRTSLLESYKNGSTEFSFKHRYQFLDKMRWIKTIVSIIENPTTGDIEAYIYAIDITEAELAKQIRDKLILTRYDIIAFIYIKEGKVDFRYSGHEFKNLPEIAIEEYDQNRHHSAKLFGEEHSEEYIRNTELDVIKQHLDSTGEYSFIMKLPTMKGTQYKRYTYNYLAKDKDIIVSTVEDITNIQEKDEAQLKTIQTALTQAEWANQAKATFLSNMSHDIRTPMNAIINMTQMAIDDLPDVGKTRDDLDKIQKSSDFLLTLINDVLDMSKIDSGKLEFHPEVYEHRDFIAYIESVFVPLCAQKEIQFTWEKADNNGPVYIDKLRFNQIFFNLLSNAVKYTQVGGKITYTDKSVPQKDGTLACDFVVSDNGRGMSEEFQKKMFQPFEREEGRVNDQGGTGLGLAIVKNTIDLAGGTIQVDSHIDQGTTFRIHLNLPLATQEQIEQANVRRKHASQVSLEGKHILIAEDNALNREIMQRILEKLGIICEATSNGKECLQVFSDSEENSIDAILMDVRMPIMDGLEATRQIRALNRSEAKSVPIIAMTANAFTEDKIIAEKAGMTGYLSKPINVHEMQTVLIGQFYNGKGM